MEKLRIVYQESRQLSKYRDLPKDGFDVRLLIGYEGHAVILQGQTVHTKIEAIQNYVQETEGIHIRNQRLFLAGEEVDANKTLADYHINNGCTVQMKSFIQILVSSLESPGPILAEIEVDPWRKESVISIKRKIESKTGLPVAVQRLYLSSDEMTTFSRRLSLDDTSTLKRYLPPSCGHGFLELRIKRNDIDSANVIVFRLPIKLEEKFQACKDVHSPHSTTNTATVAWLSVELDKSKIIRRDPFVSDLITQLQESLKLAEMIKSDPHKLITLKFCQNRTVHGGKCLDPDKKSGEYYQIRSDEQMLKVWTDNMEPPDNNVPPMVPVPQPIHPLLSYDEINTVYTSPQIPIAMNWETDSTEELDLGASPNVAMEVTAFSYSRLYGSWDTAEHYKTYVEILLEGTFYVADNKRNSDIMNDEDSDPSRSMIYYSQDLMEVTITGPENSTFRSPHLVNKNPMKWYRNSAESQRNKTTFEYTLDRPRLPFAPFRYDNRPMKLPARTEVQVDGGVSYGNNGQSRLLINNWYFGKERITHINPNANSSTKSRRYLDATCERGVTISGNPTLRVTYKAKNPDIITEEQATAFDFRIQAQFYICTLEADFEKGDKPSQSEKFMISVKQRIRRTKRMPNRADETSIVTSPADYTMRKTISINVANTTQINAAGRA